MKVKCIEKKPSKLSKKIKDNYPSSLKIDKEYVVYAMTVKDNDVWYYVCDEDYMYYPVWYSSISFEVVDGRISKYWVFSYKKGVNFVRAIPMWTFFEWADNPDYYDLLTDGKDREKRIFNSYRKLMDVEFPDATISVTAEVGNDKWLLCPLCIDAWESSNKEDAMVVCSICNNVMHNPRYKNEYPHLPKQENSDLMSNN